LSKPELAKGKARQEIERMSKGSNIKTVSHWSSELGRELWVDYQDAVPCKLCLYDAIQRLEDVIAGRRVC